MSKNLQHSDSGDRPLNRNDRITDVRRDGTSAAGKPPAQGRQEETAIEAFSDEGAGIAAKE